MRKFSYPDILTVVSAVLIVLAFPPWGFAPLIWVALIPWLFALSRARSLKAAWVQGIWLSFLMSVLGFHWVASVLHEFGNIPWVFSILALLLFGLIGQPQFLAMGPGIWFLRERFPESTRHGWRGAFFLLGLTLFYAGVDWFLPKIFTDTLGHSLFSARHLRQAADLGGAHLLTTLIFASNYALFTLLERIRNRGEPSFWPALNAALPQLGLVLLLCASAWSYGSVRLKVLEKALAKPLGYLQAGVIQGNIGDIEKIAAERGLHDAAESVIGTMLDLSDRALAMSPRPDILIWPETSYPSTFRTPQTADELGRDLQVERFVAERKIPLLFGGYDHDGRKDFNSFFVLTPPTALPPALTKASMTRGDENHIQVYHKNMLLMFGEYIPGASYIRWLRETFPQVGNFGRGPGPSILTVHPARGAGSSGSLPEVLASPVICYEALFPNYIIEAARKGSQMILNITNDSWFGPWGEPQLHLALVTFRSIESRLPQLRSTNTGISALILPAFCKSFFSLNFKNSSKYFSPCFSKTGLCSNSGCEYLFLLPFWLSLTFSFFRFCPEWRFLLFLILGVPLGC